MYGLSLMKEYFRELEDAIYASINFIHDFCFYGFCQLMNLLLELSLVT